MFIGPHAECQAHLLQIARARDPPRLRPNATKPRPEQADNNDTDEHDDEQIPPAEGADAPLQRNRLSYVHITESAMIGLHFSTNSAEAVFRSKTLRVLAALSDSHAYVSKMTLGES